MSALSARYLPMYAFGEITIVAPSSRVAGMSRCRGKAGGPAKYSLSVGGLLATTCCHLSKVTRGASDNLALLLGAARGTGGGSVRAGLFCSKSFVGHSPSGGRRSCRSAQVADEVADSSLIRLGEVAPVRSPAFQHGCQVP